MFYTVANFVTFCDRVEKTKTLSILFISGRSESFPMLAVIVTTYSHLVRRHLQLLVELH